MILTDKRFKNLLFTLSLLIVSFSIGIIGFSSIRDYGFWDAFYMTVITISTVGFNELHDLGQSGRIFVSFYIIFNISIFAYIVSVITRYLFEGELKEIYKNYMTNLDVKKLNNHVILCGYGRNGSKAAEELLKEKKSFIVIDKDVDLIKHKLANKNEILYLEGEATDDEILKLAGIDKASAIITTLPKDADNVFVSLTARELNPKINIIARASEPSSESKLYRAGANSVILPDVIGGQHMAQLITKPEVIQFIEMLSGVGEVKLKLDEITFNELKQEYKGKTIRELDIRNKTGATVIGFKNDSRGFLVNPNPDIKVEKDDVLILLGSNDEVQKCRDLCVR